MSRLFKMKMILVLAGLSALGFSRAGGADELPMGRWVCSASELTADGVTKKVLNVVFVPEAANEAVIYADSEYRVRFHRYQNPLDKTWEIAVSLNDADSNAELFRAFAQEDQAVGFKRISAGVGGYCRLNVPGAGSSLLGFQ